MAKIVGAVVIWGVGLFMYFTLATATKYDYGLSPEMSRLIAPFVAFIAFTVGLVYLTS